jgi:hypothetical protein
MGYFARLKAEKCSQRCGAAVLGVRNGIVGREPGDVADILSLDRVRADLRRY